MVQLTSIGGVGLSIFAVTSGKGGVGKSCVAAYTASALADLGKKTLLIELGGPRMMDIITGAEKEILFDAADVALCRCDPSDAIVQTKINESLFLMPASVDVLDCPNYSAAVESLIMGSTAYYEHIVVDGLDFAQVSPNIADVVLVVTTPDSLAVRACAAEVRRLLAAGAKNLRLVVNAVPTRILPVIGAQNLDDIVDQIGVQLLGVIPQSQILQYCSNNTEQLSRDSITPDVFDNIAARLLGQNRRLLVR